RACAEPRFHKYTPAAGLPELRQAIAAKTARDSGYQVEASQVLVTNGGKQAVYQTFAALLDPGDEVIVPAPYWTTYPEAIALARGAWPVGGHRRDLRAPGLRRRDVLLDPGAGAGDGRHLRGTERRGQDVRDDRLAGRLDDRPEGRDQRGGEPAEPRHLQRLQR